MSWGKEWTAPAEITIPLAKAITETGKAILAELLNNPAIKERNNKVPTHDPYTNPDAIIYYECKCGAILDPGTKSFAALNGVASDKGWKIRFGADGYTPYCVKCGDGVE